MSPELQTAVILSIEAWIEQCEAAATSDDPGKAIGLLIANLQSAKQSLELLWEDRHPAPVFERKPLARSIAGLSTRVIIG